MNPLFISTYLQIATESYLQHRAQDVLLAKVMPFFSVYGMSQPLFYQWHRHEHATRINLGHVPAVKFEDVSSPEATAYLAPYREPLSFTAECLQDHHLDLESKTRGCLDRGHLDRGHLDRGHLDRGHLDRGHLESRNHKWPM